MNLDSVLSFKAGGSAGITGPLYEIRLALFYMIKALLNNFDWFQLGLNLPERMVYKLDDIVLLYNLKGESYGLFVQAKNTSGDGICLDWLKATGNKADFSLLKYFKSYQIIKQCTDYPFPTNFRCVLQTKRGIKHKDKLNDLVDEISGDEFPFRLSSDKRLIGKIYQLKIAETVDAFKLNKTNTAEFKSFFPDAVQPDEARLEFESFLQTFFLAVEQPDENQLEPLIRNELKLLIPFSLKNLNDIYRELYDKLEKWYTKPSLKPCITRDEPLKQDKPDEPLKPHEPFESFVKWLSTAAGHESQLINPLRNPRPNFTLKWSELKQETQSYLLDSKVSFQGRQVPLSSVATSSDLEEIEKADQSFCTAKVLVSDAKLRVGTKPSLTSGYNTMFYVERAIQSVTLKDRRLIDPAHLNYIKQHSDGSWFPSRNINDHSVIKSLRNHITNDHLISQSEEEFLSDEQKVAIISDTPGMGKSTILTSFLRKLKDIHPQWWLIPVDLNDDNIDACLNQGQVDLPAFAKVLNLNDRFEQLVFQYRMETAGGVVFMLDAFDEIKEKRHSAIIKLATCLLEKYRVERLFITSRPHLQETLENELKSFSFTLRPFTKEDQMTYLVKYWSSFIDEPNQDLQLVANELIDKLSTSIRDEYKDFAGIPLQCRMLAETYLNLDSKTVTVPESLDLGQLYDRFVEKKLKISFEEKQKVSKNTEESMMLLWKKALIRKLQLKALNLLFPEHEYLWSNVKADAEITTNVLINSGLIFGPDESFIHRTFAEYFAAMFSTNMFQEGNSLNFFLQTICIEENLYVVRRFINSFLNLDTLKLENVMNNYFLWGFVQPNCLLKPVQEHCSKIVQFVIRIMLLIMVPNETASTLTYDSFPYIYHLKIPLLALNRQGRTALHLAAQGKSSETMKILLNFARELQFPCEVLTILFGVGYRSLNTISQSPHSILPPPNSDRILQIVCRHFSFLQQFFSHGQKVLDDKNVVVMRILLIFAKEMGISFCTEWINRAPCFYLEHKGKSCEKMQKLLEFSDNLEIPAPLQIRYGNIEIPEAHETENLEIAKKFLDCGKKHKIGRDILRKISRRDFSTLSTTQVEGPEHFEFIANKRKNMRIQLSFNFLTYPEAPGIVPYTTIPALSVAIEEGNSETTIMLQELAQELQILPAAYTNGYTTLHAAIENQDPESVKMLLSCAREHESSSLIVNRRGLTILHTAAEGKNPEIMRTLLDFAGEVSESCLRKMYKGGRTLLHAAAEGGSTEIMEILVARARDLHVSKKIFHKLYKTKKISEFEEHYGRTVLHAAAEEGNLDMVKMLLNLAKELQVPKRVLRKAYRNGWPVLHAATVGKSTEIVKIFLELAKELEISTRCMQQVDDRKLTVVHVAIRERNTEMLQLFLNYIDEIKFPVQDQQKFYGSGRTILHEAADSFDEEIMKVLPDHWKTLEFLEEVDSEGQTIFHVATMKSPQSLEFFLDLAQKLQISTKVLQYRNIEGKTVLHVAANEEEAMKILLNYAKELFTTVGIDAKDVAGLLLELDAKQRTVFHAAVRSRNEQNVEMLLNFAKEQKISAELLQGVDAKGRTMWHLAAENNANVMKVLLDFADELEISTQVIQKRDAEGRTVFHVAVERAKIMKVLLDYSEKLSISTSILHVKDAKGRTVLHSAADFGTRAVLNILLNYSIQSNLNQLLQESDDEEQTVLHVAARRNDPQLMMMLLVVTGKFQITGSLLQKVDKEGQTVLHVAAQHSPLVIEMLLSAAMELQMLPSLLGTQDKMGRTVLHVAAESGCLETFQRYDVSR